MWAPVLGVYWEGSLFHFGFSVYIHADWSAGKSPCFTLTTSPGHQDVTSVLAGGLAPPLSAPCIGVQRTGGPPGTQVAPSSPSARAGGAEVHVSDGSTVGVDEVTGWVSNKHRLTEGTVAHLAQLFV